MAALQELHYQVVRMTSWAANLALFGFRAYHVNRVPASGAVLYVVNHQSYLDPALVAAGTIRPMHFMARRSLFVGPFGWLIRSLNAFPVDRGRTDLKAIREASGLLARGRCVLIFPEGTRSEDGRIAPLHSGFGMLARRTGARIQPVYVAGAYRAWPRQRKLPRRRPIRVLFGRPMDVSGLDERGVVRVVTDALRALEREAARIPGMRI